jgi:hypothetical protein
MTTHFYKKLEDLTVDDVLGELPRHLAWSDGKSYLPGAYGLFSEADHYAYDCWQYLNYLKFKNGTKTPEEWCASWEPNSPEVAKKETYLKLLKGVAEKYRKEKKDE